MKKSTQYKNEFIQNNYDRINLTVPKGVKEKMKLKAESKNMSVNNYIYSLILKDMPEISKPDANEKGSMDVFLL